MLKVAIQMDPIEAVDIAGDTTFLRAETAQARGHKQWVYDFRTLALEDGRDDFLETLLGRGPHGRSRNGRRG